MSWNELIGQPLATRVLRGAVASGRIGHAYLFLGPAGVGKRDAGRILAKALICESPPAPGESCDRCRSCRKIDAGTHPDLLQVEPHGKQIRLPQITNRKEESEKVGHTPVRSFLALRPGEGKRKVVIIGQADLLNTEAANALLKSLEEPPDYAVLVLVSENPAGILPTIRSRCQPVSFPPAPLPLVAEALAAEGMPPEQAQLLAALSGGAVGRARELVQDADLARRRMEMQQLLEGLANWDDGTLLERAEGLEKRKEEVPELLDLLLLWLRDALVYAETGREELVVSQDHLPFVTQFGRRMGPRRLVSMVHVAGRARSGLDKNANVRLLLDVMLLKLAGLTRGGVLST